MDCIRLQPATYGQLRKRNKLSIVVFCVKVVFYVITFRLVLHQRCCDQDYIHILK